MSLSDLEQSLNDFWSKPENKERIECTCTEEEKQKKEHTTIHGDFFPEDYTQQ